MNSIRKDRVFIIAEAGVNHNGSLDRAIEMVDAAHRAGADCVKFQTFRTELLVSKEAGKAEYQRQSTGADESQFGMLKRLELDFEEHRTIADYCRTRGIIYCSTPFDDESTEFLARLGVPFWKVGSGELTNVPFLRRIARHPRPVILSTGMAELFEIAYAVKTLEESGVPHDDIILLHCTTEYPTPYEEVNLRAMETLRRAFDVMVGYSDHTLGIQVPVAAVALGARVIEKHFTLDTALPGPDHAASLDPDALTRMIEQIRSIEKALGTGHKKPSPSETKNLSAARKSIVCSKAISKGERFTPDNLTVKRPGDGLSPVFWDVVMRLYAGKDYDEGESV